MSARMKNPAMVLPEATKAIQQLVKVVQSAGVPEETMGLVHLRASQINGCGFCVVSGAVSAMRAGETDERLFAVSAWRDAPWFNNSERAALALAEAMTRLSERSDPVPTTFGTRRRSTSTRSSSRCWWYGSPRPTFSTE